MEKLSAKEQAQLLKMQQKYKQVTEPVVDSPMQRLHKLDRRPVRRATILGIAFGMLGALVMGTGISCCMVWQKELFIPGLIVGLIGLGMLLMTYFVIKITLKTERERVAPEILTLTSVLLDNQPDHPEPKASRILKDNDNQ